MRGMTPAAEDAVERQVRAYNERDVDAFVDCYAEAVVVEDADGSALISGREGLRERYGRLFDESPELSGEIVSRLRVGSFVVDEERISGLPDGDLHAIAIYHLDGEGLIDRVRFLR